MGPLGSVEGSAGVPPSTVGAPRRPRLVPCVGLQEGEGRRVTIPGPWGTHSPVPLTLRHWLGWGPRPPQSSTQSGRSHRATRQES